MGGKFQTFGVWAKILTLLTIASVYGYLSHHLTYQCLSTLSSIITYCHFRIQGILYFFNKMQNEGKFRTIFISFEMNLESAKSFNEFKGEDIQNKVKMHPPPREPERKNTSKIFIKIDESRVVKLRSLKKHKFKLGLNVIIIAIGNIEPIKNSW